MNVLQFPMNGDGYFLHNKHFQLWYVFEWLSIERDLERKRKLIDFSLFLFSFEIRETEKKESKTRRTKTKAHKIMQTSIFISMSFEKKKLIFHPVNSFMSALFILNHPSPLDFNKTHFHYVTTGHVWKDRINCAQISKSRRICTFANFIIEVILRHHKIRNEINNFTNRSLWASLAIELERFFKDCMSSRSRY